MTATKPEGVTLRAATDADIPRIGEIAVDAWRPIFTEWREVLGDEVFEPRHGNWQETWRNIGQKWVPTGRTLVAEADGCDAGFMTYEVCADIGRGEIHGNAVAPEFQGRGIGSFQCASVLGLFRREGLRYARVFTGRDAPHAPARGQYKRAGFNRQVDLSRRYRCLRDFDPEGTELEARPARADEAGALSRIIEEAWRPLQEKRREAVGEHAYEGDYADEPQRLAVEMEDTLRAGEDHIIVAEQRGDAVGVCRWEPGPGPMGQLHWVAVSPRASGQGVGTRLASAAMKRMVEAGRTCVEARLVPGTAGTPAERILLRLGFGRELPFVRYYLDL